MSRNKTYAVGWTVVLLIWFAVGAVNYFAYRLALAVVLTLAGTGLCTCQIFRFGMQEGRKCTLEQQREMQERMSRVLDHTSKKLSEIMELLQEPKESAGTAERDSGAQGNKCSCCGGQAFQRIAGRYVCIYCGRVLGNGKEEADTLR